MLLSYDNQRQTAFNTERTEGTEQSNFPLCGLCGLCVEYLSAYLIRC
jgi:hypothetical protein